ncbi:glycine--tRNA ligase [Candidatus Roizmanbacteria bacterium CG_4_10_14_0_2_um_filter_36_35]|uniref:glycine--tRNA ligase n=4 Tax=Candidatus Roizmaniibacteriota TaxID=1752723 RepID=A0A2M7BXI4_9BACT|nr:MAG: glycine--tRNA ligase [Candidatus Roizmanbacteria bacterium CG11_big_fil_rev_8_21_14_0_20_35_14]PIV11259.1 MAG: glycine--tRNA ligase [Candidatus Roizmanbacteria bacterium CG03_land_8_20_14_0_80_35_26]PIZ67428.1 MAG: glycine--tRNA ligase [Candidatus Roizmanbacteria bacterium CG_4_10_14_0_2_um_filter_36_35]PJC32988.1 MAG: glycine--tRNA ligase [Candidatus Roizmanbacteria bacterium CG_4_9_14_0_2_um_filter_36_12]PJC80445.1 MAG: glycine--tRNA ligase [Candidatus Roizmanbacteria bacterium CG_4_8
MDKIIALAKRRGFFYPSSEIYGGLANTWDFGHYGVLLKNNLRDWWIKKVVEDRNDIVLVDSSVILNPKVWQASGHVTGFNDALVECKQCHNRTRADHLIEDKIKKKVEGLPVEELSKIIKDNKLNCPKCGSTDLTDARRFNLLFETHIGILEENKSSAYLRGELAQGIFMNFKQVIDSMRVKVPFGIASQGVCFRNEITLGQGVFRTLQFDLMEFEYFIRKDDWEKTFDFWKETMWKMALELGLTENKMRWREHEEFERSHYSKRTMDIEYNYPFGWKEMWGLAYRTDFDLKNHMKSSTVDLNYQDAKTGEKFIPHVVEPTFGLSRLLLTLIVNAYHEEEIKGKIRTVLKIKPFLAPIKAAIFPLQKDEKLKTIAYKVYEKLKKKYLVEFDDSGNIGQMYRRQDEIGTPYCVTIDYQTGEEDTVTVRDRDSMKQERVSIGKLEEYIKEKLKV